MPMQLPEEYSDTELSALFPPGTPVLAADSPEGRALIAIRTRGLVRLIAGEWLAIARRGYRGRKSGDVASIYEASYPDAAHIANRSFENAKRSIFLLGENQVARIQAQHADLIWMRRLAEIVSALDVRTACEIGSGTGRNLLFLACQLPDLRFSGMELTRSGTQLARDLQALELHETSFGRWHGIRPDAMESVRRIEFLQGSAMEIPDAVPVTDLVFTSAALEQMADGLDRAMREIRRKTRRYALFFEPFADANDRLGRAYLWSRNYFRLGSDELASYGFEPIAHWKAVPIKPTFAYSFVLCRAC